MADLKKRAEEIVKRAQFHVAKHKQADPMAEVYETGLKRYPEFDPLVKELRTHVIREIQAKADQIESQMPYKQQFVLEELIRLLQESV